MKRVGLALIVLSFLCSSSAWALEIYLKNGDKISGAVINDNGTSLLVQTMAAGEIKINKAFIDYPKTYPEKYGPPKIVPPPVPPAPAVQWKKDLSLGYTQQGGNTKSQLGQVDLGINRKTAFNETTFKYTADYTSSNGLMNGRKFYGMGRYAYSFGNDLKWYNFYKMEGNQDKFADIEYRLNPTIGVGYWFSNTPDLKATADLGVGFQYTEYYTGTASDAGGEPVLVPHFFVDKRLFGNLHLSEDLTVYPSLKDLGNYHVRSETDLINKITARWSLKISYIDEYNSTPPAGFKKQDYTWVTSLEYHF